MQLQLKFGNVWVWGGGMWGGGGGVCIKLRQKNMHKGERTHTAASQNLVSKNWHSSFLRLSFIDPKNLSEAIPATHNIDTFEKKFMSSSLSQKIK